MLDGGNDELIKGEYIQTEDEIRKGINYCEGANHLLHRLLDKMEEKFRTL
jgi:hypothetical protein